MLTQVVSAQQFRVGIIKYKTAEGVKESYQPLFQYIANQLGERLILDIITDESLAYKLNQGDYDLGIFTPFPYLEARQDYPDFEVFASHIVHGQKTYQGGIVVRRESGIETLGDLAGKQFCSSKRHLHQVSNILRVVSLNTTSCWILLVEEANS